MKIIIRLLITVLALFVAAYVVPGISISSFYTALIVAILLGLINLILRPILLLLTLPINLLTLGLFTFVINGLLFWLVATFVKGFDVSGFLAAFLGALIVSLFSYLGHHLLAETESK
ncbi:MAG TPA: phage holin family protein [Candidatus Paceibacterota bacterium]|nr:phage holin family protein [Candidatus Paceibacterota bacterium]